MRTNQLNYHRSDLRLNLHQQMCLSVGYFITNPQYNRVCVKGMQWLGFLVKIFPYFGRFRVSKSHCTKIKKKQKRKNPTHKKCDQTSSASFASPLPFSGTGSLVFRKMLDVEVRSSGFNLRKSSSVSNSLAVSKSS